MDNKRRTTLIRILTLPLSFSAMVACTQQDVPRLAHEDAKPVPKAIATKSDEELDNELQAMNLTGLMEKIAAEKSPTALEEYLSKFGVYILNPKYTESPKHASSRQLEAMLGLYNQALLNLLEVEGSPEKRRSLTKAYADYVTRGCNAELEGCTSLAFFRTDYRSAAILQVHAGFVGAELQANLSKQKDGSEACEKDQCFDLVKVYYDLLGLSFEMRNRQRNPELDFMYIEHARQYHDYFVKYPKKEKAFQESDLSRRHTSIFENILSDIEVDPCNPRFAKFVKSFGAWNYSRLRANPFPYGTKKVFALLAKHYMYQGTSCNSDGKTTVKEGALSQEFTTALKESQEREDEAGPSMQQTVERLRNHPLLPNLLKALQLDTDVVNKGIFNNEYFFMVDRLYRGHINASEATEVWLSSKKNEQALLEAFEFYLRIVVLNQLIYTHEKELALYADRDFDTADMVQQVLLKSKPIADEWTKVFVRIDNVSNFLGANLKSVVLNQKFENSSQMIIGLKRNINYLADYPHMLLLVYFLARFDSALEITTWWGQTYKIVPSKIITRLLTETKPADALGSWFGFGDPSITLAGPQLLFVLYYAVNTGVFDLLRDKKETSTGKPLINADVFLSKLIEQYALKEMKPYSQKLVEFKKHVESEGSYTFLKRVCAEEGSGVANYRIRRELLSYKSGISTGDGVSDGLSKDLIVAFSDAVDKSDFKQFFTSLEPKLVLFRTIVGLVDESEGKSGRDLLPESRKILDEFQKTLLDLHAIAYGELKALATCLPLIKARERKIEYEFLLQERGLLERVYDAMSTVEDNNRESITKALGLMPELDVLNKDYFEYSRHSLFQRVAKFAKTVRVDTDFPPELKRADSDYSRRATVRRTDPSGNPVSKEEFVREAMQNLNGSSHSSFLAWVPAVNSLSYWIKIRDKITELYQIGQYLKLPRDQRVNGRDIIDIYLSILNFVNISGEDKDILQMLSLKEKVPAETLRGMLFNADTAQFQAPLEAIYKEYSQGIQTLAIWKLATDFFEAYPFEKKGLMYFPLRKEAEEVIRKNSHVMFSIPFMATAELLDAIKAYPKRPFDILLDLNNSSFSQYSSRQFDGELLDPQKVSDYLNIVSNLHNRKTESYYLSYPDDPECVIELSPLVRPSTCSQPRGAAK